MNNKTSLLKSLKFNYQLGKKTWFGTGGNCNLFIEVNSINQLINTIRVAKKFLQLMAQNLILMRLKKQPQEKIILFF